MSMGTSTSRGTATLALPAGSVVTQEQARARFASGEWAERSMAQFLDDAVAAHPDRVAAISVDHKGDIVREMTYSEVDTMSRRVAAGLQKLGVKPRDVVTVMMTNCAEFVAIVYGIMRAGATFSGIPITYGAHEVEVMIRKAGPKVLIVSRHFAGRDIVENALPAEVRENPAINLVVVGPPPEGALGLESVLRPESEFAPVPVDPLAIAQLGFTSGTTSEPKAVMNLQATLDAVVRGWAAHVGHESYGTPVRNLVMSPVGHATGFMWGPLLTVHLGGTAVLVEKWSAQIGARIIADMGITCMVGSPTFLIDLLTTAGLSRATAPSLKLIVVAGAPIPRPLMREAEATLGCNVIPAWGMTEFGIAVSGHPGLGDINADSDGIPIAAAAELSLRDENGKECPDGVVGNLWLRGPGMFVGYYGQEEATRSQIDGDGWFTTGDTAFRSTNGSITIAGRTKDIIIRGGENIPVAMVESLIFQHPSVTEVAVVGYPDHRLGERACAFIRLRPGDSLDLGSLRTFLTKAGLAQRYFPERVEVVDELPKTMSGKIRKVDLRAILTEEGTSNV
jgi:cyclohexanecarboxylate-CoA ligase